MTAGALGDLRLERAGGPLVIVGDSLLDVDVVGTAHRLAPDAPAPVVAQPNEYPRPGGAALCALLAARWWSAAEHEVVLITPLANDAAARTLRQLLEPAVRVIAIPWHGTSPVKTRIRAGRTTIARVDRGGESGPLGELPAEVARALRHARAILVADYGNGLTSHDPVRALLEDAAHRTPMVWDPHPRGAEPVPAVTLVTPNRAEATAATPSVTGEGLNANAERARLLHERWQARAVAITLGAQGALLNCGSPVPLVVPAPSVVAVDECGAGDSFAVGAVQALASGALPTEAVIQAVTAAAAFVADGGAARVAATLAEPAPVPATQQRLQTHDWTAAQQSLDRAQALARRVWSHGGTVVATGGCFDLLHAGHIATLEAARRLGDCLIVCLNSDDSVRRLKGSSRPLQAARDRARILRALRAVDEIVVFDEDTPSRLLQLLRPDVWVKGGDYSAESLPEADVLARWGGQVVAVPYLPERSTTALVGSARRTPSILPP